MPAIEPDTAATLARDAAERSEAAADLADRRGRDADRLTRWMVCIAISLAAALAVQMVEKRQLSHFRVSVAERQGPLRHPDPNSDPLKPWNPLPVPHLLFCLNGAGRHRRRPQASGMRSLTTAAGPGHGDAWLRRTRDPRGYTHREVPPPQYPPSVPAPEVRGTRAERKSRNEGTKQPDPTSNQPSGVEKCASWCQDPIPPTDFHPAPAAQRTALLRRRAETPEKPQPQRGEPRAEKNHATGGTKQPDPTCVDASENASLFLSLLPRSVCSSGSPRHRSGSPAPRLFPWNAGQLSGWPASASRTVGCDCHPQGRSEAKEPRSGLTAAGDRARGRRLRAQRGPKPVLPRFGKFQSFRWSGACGQVLSCVRPHYMRHILRRGPVWRYAGRVQIV